MEHHPPLDRERSISPATTINSGYRVEEEIFEPAEIQRRCVMSGTDIWMIVCVTVYMLMMICMCKSLDVSKPAEQVALVMMVLYCISAQASQCNAWHNNESQLKIQEYKRIQGSLAAFNLWASLCGVTAYCSDYSIVTAVWWFVVIPTIMWGISKGLVMFLRKHPMVEVL